MNSLKNNLKDSIMPGASWAWFAFFTQIPFVIWYAQDRSPLHPIVVMLPLVGILNFYVEKRNRDGLGLSLVQPGRSLLIALLYVGLSILGNIITLKLNGLMFQLQTITGEIAWQLVLSFFEGVFIIALWEEILNRGYIQTRLQAAWGFWGVIVTTVLFAAMHIPSALLDYENNIPKVAIRFVEAGLTGFILGFVYWRTKSVLNTIVIHGLNNFAIFGLLPVLTTIPTFQIIDYQMHFHLFWLIGQVVVTLLISRCLLDRSA